MRVAVTGGAGYIGSIVVEALIREGHDVPSIRAQQGSKRRPLMVALTGWGQDEDRRRSEEAGFDAHVVKPVDEEVLRRLVATLSVGNQEVRD